VRAFLRQYGDHIAIHKLHRNITLAHADLAELDWMLTESGEFDRDKLDHEADNGGGSLASSCGH
jgi:hypothetical protein